MSRARKRRTLRVLVLMHPDFVPPTNVDAASEREAFEWKTEYDVLKALRTLGAAPNRTGPTVQMSTMAIMKITIARSSPDWPSASSAMGSPKLPLLPSSTEAITPLRTGFANMRTATADTKPSTKVAPR